MDRIKSKNMELTLPGNIAEGDLASLRKVCINDLVVVQKNDTHVFCTRNRAGLQK